MTIGLLEAAASSVFSRIEIHSAGDFAHSKLNAAHLNTGMNYAAELLVVCHP